MWAPAYPPYAHNLLMEVEEQGVLALLPDVRGLRVLDLACGSARYARLLHARGAQVVGVDLSFEMLAQADPQLARVQGNLTALPLVSRAADCVVCGLAVGHVRDLTAALSEMARVLVGGGTLVYSDFHPAGDALGWKRTFRANRQTYAIRHFARTAEEQAEACRRAGLEVNQIKTCYVTPELAQANQQAAAFRKRWGDTPIALVVQARAAG